MASTDLERAKQLKQALVDYVYDAEGDLAVALEAYVAEWGSRERQGYDVRQQGLVFDAFLSEGEVNSQTPIALFAREESSLSAEDRALLDNWQNSFTGLFEVLEIQQARFELMNWLTAKQYTVFPSGEVPLEETQRWQPGDIILTRLAPLGEGEWMFSGGCVFKGKLGKPKLAVAIGEFKKNFPDRLYSDAPELLEEAWESVSQYHQEFVDYFGSDRLELPGYQLESKLGELQQRMTQKRLEAAGIDSSKSLKEIARERGVDEAELEAAVEESGSDASEVKQALESKLNSRMITPKVDLPDAIKKAERVTLFSHPRWGQMILPTYPKLQDLLEAEEPLSVENYSVLVRKALEDPQINYFVWQQLKVEHPSSLEKVLQAVLNRQDFQLERDLDEVLAKYDKVAEPQLPEIASVPIHLHDLFQEAVAKVNESKGKTKKKTKSGKGFK
ncbi:hypothetical protein [Oscillatoria sp. FACHB-1406]|uniref:hypothetical protein n=1 Tax=Oscillatoria sp. FACHB-1406 TaxID=2692846 RepID=UPI001683ABC6|nr:hypothetical protein [Oscillatoria sp. FACHB-1406]MBD2578200.1 hypothetical protein [Oscillatoria sp. FACHB-1406]